VTRFHFCFLLLMLLVGCAKQEKCATIYDKIERDGRYFFILDEQFGVNSNEVNDPAAFLPDNRMSGEVSSEIYAQYAIGNEYCQ